jgi:hypothetical protein
MVEEVYKNSTEPSPCMVGLGGEVDNILISCIFTHPLHHLPLARRSALARRPVKGGGMIFCDCGIYNIYTRIGFTWN